MKKDQTPVVLAIPPLRLRPEPSWALIAWQASYALRDLRPLFDRWEVRLGLFRLAHLLNRSTPSGAALRMLALHLANALTEVPERELHDWVRTRLRAALEEVVAARQSGALRPLPQTEVFLQYRTELDQ